MTVGMEKVIAGPADITISSLVRVVKFLRDIRCVVNVQDGGWKFLFDFNAPLTIAHTRPLADPFAEIAGVLPKIKDVGACETGLVEIRPFASEYWLRKSLLPER